MSVVATATFSQTKSLLIGKGEALSAVECSVLSEDDWAELELNASQEALHDALRQCPGKLKSVENSWSSTHSCRPFINGSATVVVIAKFSCS